MSRKNHQMVEGRLIQTNKPFSQLKQRQKIKINEWLYAEYRSLFVKNGKALDKHCNDDILDTVYEKICAAEIWIPFGEVRKYFYSHKNKYRKRCEAEKDLNME